MPGSTGTGSVFGYTGEQFDAETGYTYLRARYLNPSLSRFTSADTMQPNAPGTQGYNLYGYVANNPTTWVDPSGHCGCDIVESVEAMQALTGTIMAYGVGVIPLGQCVLIALPLCVLPVAIGALVCALTPSCLDVAMDLADIIQDLGSVVWDGIEWTWERLEDILDDWPVTPGQVWNTVEDAWAALRPALVQCLIWGVQAGATGGGAQGMLAGCVAGALSYFAFEYLSQPGMAGEQCGIWGFLTMIGTRGKVGFGLAACAAGAVGSFTDRDGLDQCIVWGIAYLYGAMPYDQVYRHAITACSAAGIATEAS